MALLLLLSLSLLSFSSATVTAPPQTPIPSLSQTLSSLGFHDLAAAAATIPPSAWHAPITVFVPSTSSLSTCPSCSLSLLLQEHTLPGLFPLPYLRSLLSGTRIESLSPGRCLSITHSLSNPATVFLSGVELTHPNLYSDAFIVVHVINGYITHLSPSSCSLERMTSLSFLPNQHPPRGTVHKDDNAIMRLMLKDAILRLRLTGYSILSIALKLKSAELADLESFTVFALNDVAIFSPGGHAYVPDFKFHVVPNRLLLAGDLDRLVPGTVLPTMGEKNEHLVVTDSGGGIGGAPARVNYVKVTSPDLLFNLKIAIHGVKMPFPKVNVTSAAAIGVSKKKQPRYDDGNSAVAGDAAVGYSVVAPTKADIGINKWTAEIEDHHGL